MPLDQPGARARRVAEAVREELSLLLAREVKDPRASGAVVTSVEMTGDLRSARVRVRLLDPSGAGAGGDDRSKRRALVEALERASGLLRREVTRRLGLRHAPELRFAYDDGLDELSRVEGLLAEIEADRRRAGRGSAK
ncbi:MAG: 30S ribosome-binding factor RbfA [Myxococcales bacterium]|nr:30S ribosome-binding factor RbfA [Myxococcales bacterium]